MPSRPREAATWSWRVPAENTLRCAIVGVCLLLVTSCGGDLPDAGESSNQSTRKEVTDQTQYFKPSTEWEEIAKAHEDPDPMVNPREMFMPAPEDKSKVNENAVLNRTLDANPANLNPMFASSAYEQQLSAMLFDGPFSFNAKMEWTVNSAMVESFEVSEDHLNYTVKLKKGLKWHDGAPFTAHDIVFSWEQYWDDRVEIPAGRDTTKKVVKCVAVDDHTLQMTCESVSPVNKWNIYFSLLPKHIYEKQKQECPDLKSNDYYNDANRAPIGNGPYKFVSWKSNDRIELERWEDYPGEKPHFKRVILKIIPEDNIKLIRFSSQDVDDVRMVEKQFALQTGPETDFAKVGNKLKSSQWAYRYIGLNMDGSNPFFADKRVRLAMAHAYNRDRIIQDLTYNLSQPCHGVFHPQSPCFNRETQLISFDIEKAGRLLDEAGWRIDTSRGGWRYKTIDGAPRRFSFTIHLPLGNDFYTNMAAIFAEDLKKIGVELKQQTIEFASLIHKTRKHEFEAFSMAWGTGVDPDLLYNVWHSTSYTPDGSSGRNYVKYENSRVDELFDQARRELDEAKRIALFQEIGKLIYEDQPYIFINNPPLLFGINKRIQGITVGPRGLYGFDPSWRAWWTPAEMK